MHASRHLAPGGLPGGRGLFALFQGSPSAGELREDHREFWVLLFQRKEWKRTLVIQQLLLGWIPTEHSTGQTLLKHHVPPESLACSAQVRDKHLQYLLHVVLHVVLHSLSNFPN